MSSATIVTIIPAGCNRECFALTEEDGIYLLEYEGFDENLDWTGEYKWVKMPDLEL